MKFGNLSLGFYTKVFQTPFAKSGHDDNMETLPN